MLFGPSAGNIFIAETRPLAGLGETFTDRNAAQAARDTRLAQGGTALGIGGLTALVGLFLAYRGKKAIGLGLTALGGATAIGGAVRLSQAPSADDILAIRQPPTQQGPANIGIPVTTKTGVSSRAVDPNALKSVVRSFE